MFLPLVLCALFLQNVFGYPMLETDEDPDWLPRYSRDFEIFDSDHWYKWWYGGKRKSTVQERIQTLETRQQVLFELVVCESHNRIRTFVTDECELFRKKAEQVFAVPAKGSSEGKIQTPSTMDASTTIIPEEEVTTVAGSTAAPTVPPVSSTSSAPLIETTPAAA